MACLSVCLSHRALFIPFIITVQRWASAVIEGQTQPAGAGGQAAGPPSQGKAPGTCREELLHQSGQCSKAFQGRSATRQWGDVHFKLVAMQTPKYC